MGGIDTMLTNLHESLVVSEIYSSCKAWSPFMRVLFRIYFYQIAYKHD